MKKTGNKRLYFFSILLFGFFALLLADPSSVLESGRKAAELCLNIIIPSLLPFFVICRLILKTGAIGFISRIFRRIMKPLFNLPGSAAFPLIAGWLSGYPAGAKYTADLYNSKLISKDEAQRLLAFCNNSGPLFIVGAVGTGFFNSSETGAVLLLCHILASITVGIGVGLLSRVTSSSRDEEVYEADTYQTEINGQILTDAIWDSVMALLKISGTIIFFAVLVQTLETAGLFSALGKLFTFSSSTSGLYFDISKVFVAGGLEVTYGLYLLSLASGIPVNYKIILTAFLCGFGGFSVHTQVAGICSSDFSLKTYLIGKLLQGLIAAIYTGLFFINRPLPVINTVSGFTYAKLPPVLPVIYCFLLLFVILLLFRRKPFQE